MLTDTKIRAAMKAVTSETTLTDRGAGRGAGSLQLVIRRRGDGTASATWFAKVKRGGKRTKRSLGPYPDVPLAAARAKMLDDVAPALRDGKGLRAAVVGEAPTVERMFRAFVDDLRAKGRRPEYADEVERMLLTAKSGSAADDLGRDAAPGDVTPAAIAAHIRRFIRKGRRGAGDKARAYLSAAFGWAMKAANDPTVDDPIDWGVTANPTAAVKRDEGAHRTIERNLSAHELRALWAATEPAAKGFSTETAAAIRLVVCAGQRIQETLRIDGCEIDLDAALWNMPAAKTKGGERPHTVPLVPQAVDVLRRLKEVHGDGPLFPSRDEQGGRIDHRSVRQAITRWLSTPGVRMAHFTPRDLRRTWKSRAGDGAMIDRETRDLIQQHARGDTGSVHYDRADYLPKMREAMGRWGEWLATNVTSEPTNGHQQAMAA